MPFARPCSFASPARAHIRLARTHRHGHNTETDFSVGALRFTSISPPNLGLGHMDNSTRTTAQ
eukprot:9364210-Alexandrium_andersonii.AAC.1